MSAGIVARLRNFVNDKNSGINIISAYVDAELNQLVASLNCKQIAASSAPANPTLGDTWVDTSTTPPTQKVYTLSGWAAGILSIGSQAQGDILYYDGSGWARLAAGTSGQVLKTNGASANPTWSSVSINGQCRLTKSGGNLLLSPYNGSLLTISGVNYVIPAAGVTLAPPATNGTSYFIYAYMSGATMTLEASATAHATDTSAGNIGVEIKSGDNTRTLVGQARTVSSAWVDTAAQRFVTSWFNRKRIVGSGTFSTDRSVSSTTYGEINAEVQVQFLAWADDSTFAGVTGSVNATNKGSNTSIAFDSATTIEPTLESACYAAGAIDNPIGISGNKVLAEGYHYATILGASTGTSNWRAASSGSVNSAKVYLNIGLMG